MKVKRLFVLPIVVMLIMFCTIKHFTITSDAHTHQFNSQYSLESTRFVKTEKVLEYDENGQHYEVWWGYDIDTLYQTCYCGARGNYKYEYKGYRYATIIS